MSIFDFIDAVDIEGLGDCLKHGADPNARHPDEINDEYSYTPLQLSCFTREIELIRILLENGADPNEKSDYNGGTSLHIAVIKDNEEIVKLLLEFGANPNEQNRFGHTPLHIASGHNNLKIIKLLLGFGADYKITDDQHEICLRGFSEEERNELIRNHYIPPCFDIKDPGFE
jgi:ankyrin repeat protein